MRRFPLRRALGALLSFAIVAGAPGSHAYHAAAQTLGRAAATANAGPGAIGSAGGLSGPAASVPVLAPTALSLAPALLTAPSVSPEARVAPVAALASFARTAPAAEVTAVPAGPARAVAARGPLAAAPKTGPPAAAAPAALTRGLAAVAAPAKDGKLDRSGDFFDGSSRKADARTPVVAPAGRGGWSRALTRGLAILTLSVGMLGAQHQASAQTAPPAPAPIQQPAAQAQPQAAAEARVILPRPIEASASVDRQGITVGERVRLTLTLRNTSDKPVTLQNLRNSVQEALPSDLELQGRGAEAPLTLAPGETKTVVYEAIPFGSGTLTLDGGIAVVSVGETAVYPEGIEIVMPKTELEVKTVLTPDWKQKGLRDYVGVKRADGPSWMWLAAIPLGILMFVGVHRLVAARRLYPKLDAKRLSLVTVTEAELARLEAESAELDAASFYARFQDLLTGFMVDFAGLPKAARDARTLGRDLHKSFYDAGQVSVASRLAAAAEAARFGGEEDAGERARSIERFRALIGSVAGKSGKPRPADNGLFATLALLPGAAGLSFGSPWALLLLVPLAAYALWSWGAKSKSDRFAVSSPAQTPGVRTLRERLAGLPRALRMAAVGLIIVALARPMIGTERSETFIPSTDTVVSIDLSGSMSGAKLEGVRDAVRAYVEEQRRGTENRVGMVTFSDTPYLDVKLTTDYDALISHLKELETTGSTAIGKSMLTSIAHFLELNALELDGKTDPRAAEVQRLLRDQGLSAALAYAKQHPDLLKTILQPERAKIVVLFTDGDSNSGIDPQAAAEIAASLGVKIYGVGIAGPNESFNEATLRGVAEKTGAKFYRAGDANAMRSVLLEISRLEKSPAKIVSSVSVKDYTSLLALLAFLLIGAELTLVNTRLRTLYGLAFIMGLNGAPMFDATTLGDRASMVHATQMTLIVDEKAKAPSVTTQVPAEMIEGNKLYNQGRYAEALKKYAEALENHPDVPELYFNMADAYLRLGENAKADAAWAKYLSLTPDPKKQSQAVFNLANSALQAGDAEKAVELYKEALRRDADNQDAKWNLEALRQQQKEQEQQQKDSKDSKKGKPGKQKGKPGDGKPGDGKPGDGKPQAKPGDPKEGADKLGEALGEQEKGEKDAARQGMTRKGSGVWGLGALPLAMAGPGIVFSSSMFLWVVGIGVPVIALLIAWGIKKRLDAARRLSPGTAPKSFRSWWGARRFLGKSAMALAAVGLLGLAAGDPRGGMVDERVNFGGKDIVVTVDGSYSMIYAEDGRMARTQKELNEFITRLQGTDRVGLVVFAGKARTASPISIDYGNFEFKINRLDVESRGIKEGSDLASAIKYSAAHFETAKKLGDRQRIMIVISDGDVPDAEIAAAITAATEHGVTVYAIGVGDPAGTKIKVPTADGSGEEYLIDGKTGAPAVTRLNEGPLRQLAERTGGAYFRSGGKASIDDILKEVSRLEKGQKGDTIKSPRPVGVYLLWPALLMLLLDLVLPGRSLLKRGASAPRKKDDKSKSGGPGGAALMGAALIPLGAWPQILPFAALATVVAGYLAADSWSGGAITRRAREAWQRWHGVVEKGVASDLIHLYDLREADERRLTAFVKGWQSAKEPARRAMIETASRDEALWREKLTASYLSGASPETQEKILTALRRTARARLEPLTPVVERLSLRRADISWMAHSDAEARLASLAATAAGRPAAFEAPKSAPSPSGLLARLRRGASAAVLALMLAVTGAASVGTIHFQAEQRAAAEVALKLFYAEDLFVFSDRYVDERISREVIPALQRWHESPKTAGPAYERALTILRESPDPKADNILVAIFRHAGVLPLTNQAENTLLRALIERESDMLWNSMDALITQSRTDEASAQLLVKLVILGVESGNEKAIVQSFRVLKSPNKQVQQMAAGVLYSFLSQGGTDSFYARLGVAQAKHAADPMLQMWTASFAFRRLAEPGAGEADLLKAKAFLNQALVNAKAIDALRLEIFKQTPPDQEVQAPPSLVTLMADMAAAMQGDGNAPAPLAAAARFFVSKVTTDLIKEGEKAIPGLHARLIEDGVVLPDTQTSNGYYGDYYDEHGHGGYYGRGEYGVTTSQNYREVYKLAHLNALRAAIEEMGGPIAADAEKNDPVVREFLDRSLTQLESLGEAGAKAGMMQGGTAAEAAADQLLSTLRKGDTVFAGHAFLNALRAAGLTPAAGDPGSQLAYPESLDAAQLAKLRALLLGLANSGQGWDGSGKSRPLTWSEKLYLSEALDAIAATQAKQYPDAAVAGVDDASLALARLSRELTAHPKNPVFALNAQKTLIGMLARSPLDAGDAGQVLTQILAEVGGTEHEAAAVAALVEALKTPNGGALAPATRARAALALKGIGELAERAFPLQQLNKEMVASGLRENTYSWRGEFTLRHYQVLRAAIDAAAEKTRAAGALSATQLEAVHAAKSLAPLESLAAAAGARAGDSPAEIAADRANARLLEGHRIFPGTSFNDSLRAAKLMPGTGNSMSDYRQSYTRAEIEGVRDWLKALVASGQVPEGARALNWSEKLYLIETLNAFDAVLKEVYGAAASAPETMREAALRPGERSLAAARLVAAMEARPDDAARALEAQEIYLGLLARGEVDATEADEVLARVFLVLEGRPEEARALSAFTAAISGPNGAGLKEFGVQAAEIFVRAVVEPVEKELPDFKAAVVETGAREKDGDWRGELKIRHIKELRAAVEAKAASVKSPSAAQKAALDRARRDLALVESLAVASGVPAGSPGDAAAEILNPALQAGYQIFPGTQFNDRLREKGFMAPGSSNGLDDHKQEYTAQEVAAIRDWLKGVLASGQGWDSTGKLRPLEDKEKDVLKEALAASEKALTRFPSAATKGLHAFAPLALAALPAMAPWLIFTVLGLGAAYLVWKLLPAIRGEDAVEPEARESVPASVVARHRRIELVARRMATAVNGGAFRSRFIGAGGTDFAEARPYQGEDLREVDWKTSAKKDELYAKKFELERDMPLMLVVDISRSGSIGTRGADKRTAIEDAAAVLALAAAHSNIRVGLVLVSDRVEQVIPARGGSRHAMMVVDAILRAQPTGAATDLKPGLEAAGKLLGSRAMVAVLSDFIAPDFKDALGAIASRHDVRAVRVTDPAEMGPLPDVGLLPVVDAETGATRMLDTSSRAGRAAAAAAVSAREAAVEAAFSAARLDPISISTEGDPLESLERSFHPKSRQPFTP